MLDPTTQRQLDQARQKIEEAMPMHGESYNGVGAIRSLCLAVAGLHDVVRSLAHRLADDDNLPARAE